MSRINFDNKKLTVFVFTNSLGETYPDSVCTYVSDPKSHVHFDKNRRIKSGKVVVE